MKDQDSLRLEGKERSPLLRTPMTDVEKTERECHTKGNKINKINLKTNNPMNKIPIKTRK